uniref:Insulin-like growth factor binding protein 5b n=1 Tax=Hucho hucho TaxID=62062 RepID=A0A4W5PQZ0_9TELE
NTFFPHCITKIAYDKPNKPLYHESLEHEDTLTTEITEDQLQPAKVPLLPKQDLINSKKIQAMRKDRDRKRAQAKLHSIGHMDYSPLPIDKHEPEFGPCRRKLDGIIQGMKDTSRVMALSLYLPNCDRKGFFKRKQCKPSRGRKRGICWCVDKYGSQVPGTDYSGGDIQCKDLESSSINE